MRIHRSIPTLLFLSLCLGFAACSKKTEQQYPHLQFIPADTTYAIVSLEPAPDEVIKKFEQAYAELGEAYFNLIKNSMQKTGDFDQNKIDELLDKNPWLDALAKEFMQDGEISLNAIRNFGVDSGSTYALYGHGVLPVLRMRLSDPKLFNAAIARIETNAKDKLPSIQVKGENVWEVAAKEFKVHFVTQANDLVVSVSPANLDKKFLPDLLGFNLPESSLASAKTFASLMDEKDYLPVSLGFIDFERILDRFIEPMRGVDMGFATAMGKDNSKNLNLSASCKSELRGIVKAAPRLVFGATEYDAKNMNIETLLEMDPALATKMTGLTSAVPGLGELNGLFSMGFSFNLKAMREFGLERIAHFENNPYQCEFLQIPDTVLVKSKQALSNPATGMLEGIRGFNVVIDEVDQSLVDKVIELEASGASKSEKDQLIMSGIGGHAVIAVDDTENLYNMGKMFSPELAQLDLKPDGKPKVINDISPQALPIEVQAAMTDTAYIFSFGKNAEKKSALVQGLESEPHSPLISYAVDMDAYIGLINKVFDSPKAQEEMLKDDEFSELSDLEDMQKILESIYNLFDSMIVNFRFRDDGIVIEQNIKMKK
ncbi:MAG: hypothetical protein HKO58_08245 [Gammaproteobacteria bacterium]|nr:hypothetical protein [Gammaproteobacteria bacterium]